MRRALAAITAVTLLLAGCTPSGDPAPATEAATDAVLASRDALGEPMLQLAQAAIALADGIAAARHELPRGPQVQRQVGRLAGLRDDVRDASTAAMDAAAEAPVRSAAAIVETAAAQAQQAAAAAGPEIAYLRRLVAIDLALLAAAAEWDRPGSQSEIRARLDALADKVGRLRAPLRSAKPAPAACGVMQRNRTQWIATVRERTLELQAQANSAGGATFDRLRSSYRALPFAQEPRTADRADRACWQERSPVAKAAAATRAAVDRLREALST